MRLTPSYSLWVMPCGDAESKLKQIIKNLSREYNAPYFPPHITLISSFQGNEKNLIGNLEELGESKIIKPFKIKFDKIAVLKETFRSVFIDCEENESLIQARNSALKLFSCKEKKYLPHASLIYKDLKLSEKYKIISSLNNLPDQFEVNKIFLAYNNEKEFIWKVIKGVALEA